MDRSGEVSVSSRPKDQGTERLDEIQKTQLELTARLISCGQRLALCRLEQENMGNLKQLMFSMIDNLPKFDDLPRSDDVRETFAPSPSSVVAQTPFMSRVLKDLFVAASETLSAPSSQPISSDIDDGRLPIFAALKESMLSEDRVSVDRIATRSLLQIVAACAEAFPSGACWASRSFSCWSEIPSKQRDLEYNRQVHSCDPQDLAAVVMVVARILESHGDHDGDTGCQKWALRCLIRLAKATSCLTLVTPDCDTAILGSVWQTVWSIVFRSDLRYSACTANTGSDSVAELVLWTLSAIIRNLCTDPHLRWIDKVRGRRSSFLYRKQGDLWNLPVFSLVGDISSLAPFDVIVSLLHSVGLSEGSDSVGHGLKFKVHLLKTLPELSRRLRLINFCLCQISTEGQSPLIGAAVTSLAALLHGQDSKWSTSLHHICCDLPVLELPTIKQFDKHTSTNLYDILWSHPKPLINADERIEQRMDSVSIVKTRLENAICFEDKTLRSLDILAASQSHNISTSLEGVFGDFVGRNMESIDDESTALGEIRQVIESSLLRLKFGVCVFMGRNKESISDDCFHGLSLQLSQLLQQVARQVQVVIRDAPNVLDDVYCVVNFIIRVTSLEQLDLPSTLLDDSQDFTSELEKWLALYENEDVRIGYDPVSPRKQNQPCPVSALDLDDDDLENRIQNEESSSSSRKRVKSVLQQSSFKRPRKALNVKSLTQVALKVVRLLLAMKPNLRTMRFIIEKLLGVDLDKPIAYYDSNLVVDPYLSASLTRLFSPLLRFHDSTAGSGASLLCRLVLMTRRNSPPHSLLHMFGYRECASFCLDDGWKGLPAQTQSDAKELLTIWTELDPADRRSFSLRPSVRALSISTMCEAYAGGGDVIRDQWVQEHPRHVISSFYDRSFLVRKVASVGLTFSLEVALRHDQVADSAIRNLPPVSSRGDSFREWYKSGNGEGGIQDRQTWEDSRKGLEFFCLYSKALFGGYSKAQKRQESLLFGLCEIAHDRSDLEVACFMFTDFLAFHCGFGTAEMMLTASLDSLIQHWWKRQENGGLLEIPLLLSAPSLLRFLVRTGSTSCFHDTSDNVFNNLRTHAANEFFARYARYTLPGLLVSLHDTGLSDKRLVDLCSIYDKEGDEEETISKLIRGHISSLTAFTSFLECLSPIEEQISLKLTEVIQRYGEAPGLVQLRTRHISSTAKYFIEYASTATDTAKPHDFLSRIVDKFSELSGVVSESGVTDPFRQVGLTLSEVCIASRSWTSTLAVEWLGLRRIQNMKILWSIISRGSARRRTDLQIEFLFLLFSDICCNCTSTPLLVEALNHLRHILVHLTAETTSVRLSRDVGVKNELRVLFCSILRLRQRLESDAKRIPSTSSTLHDILERRARGLAVDISFSAIMIDTEHSSEQFGNGKPKDEEDYVELMKCSGTVLKLIVENCSLLGLQKCDVRMSVPTLLGDDRDYKIYCNELGLGTSITEDMHRADIYHRLTSKRPFVLVTESTKGGLSPHQHLLLSELQNLFLYLSSTKTQECVGYEGVHLLRNLAMICLGAPDEICAAASRCIGALHAFQDCDEVLSPGSSYLGDDPVVEGQLAGVLEGRCLELLIGIAKSPCVSTAVIAMDSSKALLSGSNGMDYREASGSLLLHFVPATKVRHSSLVLNAFEMMKIKDCFVTNETWIEWCWDEAFWVSCLDWPFEKWICYLVPAIISCHFGVDNKNSASGQSGGFILHCQRISLMEPAFAVTLFPLLMLQLVSDQQSNGQKPQSQVHNDAWIGHPSSPVIGMISKCFGAVLRSCATREKINESRAVGLIVDTLDMIRRLQQHRFLVSTAHIRNPATLKAFRDSVGTSKSPSQEASSTKTEDYPLTRDPVEWRGIPFGVGLFINGRHLAEACYKVKKYCSALFYAENYAEFLFGGSTLSFKNAIEELKAGSRELLSSDISGYHLSESRFPITKQSLVIEAKSLSELMAGCCKALGANDQLDALVAQVSDVMLLEEQSTLSLQQDFKNSWCPSRVLRQVDPDMSSGHLSEGTELAFDSLSKLNLFGTLQTSLKGFACSTSDPVAGDRLKEKWFEACLFGNSLETQNGASFSYDQFSSDRSAGFCESILTALTSFTCDDYNISRIHIEDARVSTFDDIAELVASEASTQSSSILVDKLRCLNNLEKVLATQGNSEGILGFWEENDATGAILERTIEFPRRQPLQPFTNRVQELVLQHICSSQGESGSPASKVLSSLLWTNANFSCSKGKAAEAHHTFRRLSAIHGSAFGTPEFFQVRHLEARILQLQGEFSSAIRHASQSIDRLSRVQLNRNHDETKADLMLCCGRWMATHRVDSAEKILENYLKPGLELARRIHGSGSTTKSAERVTEACIALGDLVFNIYQTVAARVKSPEWEKAGMSLETREAEYREYDKIVKGQPKGKTSKQDWDQWLKDLLIFMMNLQRDVRQIRSERKKIEKSIDEYKDLAFRTFIEALSAADGSYNLMSKYVYRMVEIWLSSKNETTEEDIFLFDSIPSYRFVQLSNQLFSRLTRSNLLLKRLTKRLCSDHPYHCLSQMIRLCNSPSNDRDKEKAKIAKETLHSIKDESPEFLAHLTENYEHLLESYVYLAEVNSDTFSRGNTKKIGFSTVYTGKVTRLDHCVGRGGRRKRCPPCVLTSPPSLRSQCDYGGGIDDPVGGERIERFDDHFSIADSGITRPKIVRCIGSKGGRFKQLVKGGVSSAAVVF